MPRWLREVTMGLVRKTLSVATLGAVSFRGKKERLRRADRALRDAEQDLARERSARETAERRIGAAEERVKHATTEASHAARTERPAMPLAGDGLEACGLSSTRTS